MIRKKREEEHRTYRNSTLPFFFFLFYSDIQSIIYIIIYTSYSFRLLPSFFLTRGITGTYRSISMHSLYVIRIFFFFFFCILRERETGIQNVIVLGARILLCDGIYIARNIPLFQRLILTPLVITNI